MSVLFVVLFVLFVVWLVLLVVLFVLFVAWLVLFVVLFIAMGRIRAVLVVSCKKALTNNE